MSKVVCPHRYLDNQVFVSLANGELVVYQREAGEVGFGTSKMQPQSGGFLRGWLGQPLGRDVQGGFPASREGTSLEGSWRHHTQRQVEVGILLVPACH